MSLQCIVIAGVGSNTGKTTLLCELLLELSKQQPWEAIKLTRGHYRSCGKDPHACCVSHLLSEEPLVRSGREETYTIGKDTGRYWDAGASNVHWVIVTDNQVQQGIGMALARVKSGHVLIEGTSVLKFINPDFAVMVARADQLSRPKIKPTARRALSQGLVDVFYFSGESGVIEESFPPELAGSTPVYNNSDLPRLISRIQQSVLTSPRVSKQ